jgi:hypothetical protein
MLAKASPTQPFRLGSKHSLFICELSSYYLEKAKARSDNHTTEDTPFTSATVRLDQSSAD